MGARSEIVKRSSFRHTQISKVSLLSGPQMKLLNRSRTTFKSSRHVSRYFRHTNIMSLSLIRDPNRPTRAALSSCNQSY